MKDSERLKPCPFCGGSASFGISDDEGNDRDESYELDPWSGLSFRIVHTYQENKECPIAAFKEDGGYVGVNLFDSREQAAHFWNKRANQNEEQFNLSEEEWLQISIWLTSYRVQCNKEQKEAKHTSIAEYYKKTNSEVREFQLSKEQEFKNHRIHSTKDRDASNEDLT